MGIADDARSPGISQDGAAPVMTDPDCQPSMELCDGSDNDCDGVVDEDVKTRCWSDQDGDGFGAKDALAVEKCACGPKETSVEPVRTKVDCADDDAKRAPGLKDACGDGIDNDCDGTVDGTLNACGACGPVPTEICDTEDNDCDGMIDEGAGVKNACGTCGPVPAEDCSTAGDDNCNGVKNEGCAPPPPVCTSKTWYRDCDADGYAEGASGSMDACEKPTATSDCRGWTSRSPNGSGALDCDDSNAARFPGAPFSTTAGGNGDLNCDDRTETKVEFVASDSFTDGSNRTYRFCTNAEVTSGSCVGCYASTALHEGFTAFGQKSRVMIPYFTHTEGPPPCAKDRSTVLIINEMTPTCGLIDVPTIAVRILCR